MKEPKQPSTSSEEDIARLADELGVPVTEMDRFAGLMAKFSQSKDVKLVSALTAVREVSPPEEEEAPGSIKLQPGVMITDRLRLVRPIGHGGMGWVWAAYHEALKTEVAVKLVRISADDARSEQKQAEGSGVRGRRAGIQARFEREAMIAAKLKSPHVAQMYDCGSLADGTQYIVMELLEGRSLQQRLKQEGPLSPHETSLVLGQAAQALGKAHDLRIFHRDVKPANLFLADTGYELFVKLLDFGIAKAPVTATDQALTKTGHLLGSPLYMSPEQLTKVKSVDHRTDLWSLAVVAYECLTGKPPFFGEAIGNVILAVVAREYRPVTEVVPSLPAALDAWFERAFHFELDARFQSAKELATAFAELIQEASGPPAPRAAMASLPDTTDGEPAAAQERPQNVRQIRGSEQTPGDGQSAAGLPAAETRLLPSGDEGEMAPQDESPAQPDADTLDMAMPAEPPGTPVGAAAEPATISSVWAAQPDALPADTTRRKLRLALLLTIVVVIALVAALVLTTR